MTAKVDVVWTGGAILGEGAAWVPAEGAVYWVDIKGLALHRLILDSGAQTSWALPDMVGWIIPRANGAGFVAGLRGGPALLSLDPVSLTPLLQPEPEHPGNRLNDAIADASGRIWFGSMDNAEEADTGSLYRLDPDGSCHRMDSGYGIANGPAISPDGRTLYHTDSARRTIYAFDLAPEGTLANRRVHIRFEEDWGYPDGMAADAEGGLWVAHWGGGRVSRFHADGTLDRAIALPVAKPTKPVFAGPGLDRMFVTSASIGDPDEPHAGALFEVDPGVRGLPPHSYAG